MAQWLTNPTRNHEVVGSFPDLAQWAEDPAVSGLQPTLCCELWCRLQTRLGSHVAVAVAQAGGYSSDSTPSLGTSMCCGSSPRKGKRTKTLSWLSRIFGGGFTGTLCPPSSQTAGILMKSSFPFPQHLPPLNIEFCSVEQLDLIQYRYFKSQLKKNFFSGSS